MKIFTMPSVLVSVLFCGLVQAQVEGTSSPENASQQNPAVAQTKFTLACPMKGCVTIFGQSVVPKACDDKGSDVEWTLKGKGDVWSAYIALTDEQGKCGCFTKDGKNIRYQFGEKDGDSSYTIDLGGFDWSQNCEGAAVCTTGYTCPSTEARSQKPEVRGPSQ